MSGVRNKHVIKVKKKGHLRWRWVHEWVMGAELTREWSSQVTLVVTVMEGDPWELMGWAVTRCRWSNPVKRITQEPVTCFMRSFLAVHTSQKTRTCSIHQGNWSCGLDLDSPCICIVHIFFKKKSVSYMVVQNSSQQVLRLTFNWLIKILVLMKIIPIAR